MYLHLITVQEVSFYNVYKSELLLRAICCSFCQFIVNLLRSEFTSFVNGQILMFEKLRIHLFTLKL